ncbi:Fatty acid hydroxylase vlmA [Pseudocercospora fuligena]|uniref:Fatty acid hydroxylase vlmA n=1 Tax=Pseudocercospora fuligena TaxID=685502 RepID=A0A8H6R616_9PEZI|nr:Fatty acid hydroxylase vlmA [Pseudocercospora fuligena]
MTTNPKDSMTSTWRTADRNTWTTWHWWYEWVRVHPTDLDREVPVHDKSDPIPVVSHFQCHKWVLVHALWPLALHRLYCWTFGRNVHPFVALIFYTVVYKMNGVHELMMIRDVGHTHGFLDGDKHARDGVPDHAVKKVFNSLISTLTVRSLMVVFFAYRRNEVPTLSWWLIPEIGFYLTILDFWFYWYHRSMHQIDRLWKYHRTHHLTKHPNPLLTLYADAEQEIFDIAVIPLLTYWTMKLMGFPLGFGDLWVCNQYQVFTELFGHSGLRVLWRPPTTANWFLDLFDAQLVLEDHDLHHRKGWKNSFNYGKQTVLWDKAFGTHAERIESKNVDWSQQVTLKLWVI